MCHYDTADVTDTGARVCTGTGNLPACQLCPGSPTYWRNTPTEPVTPGPPPAPFDLTGWTDDRTPPDNPADLDALRCVLCRMVTTWISPKGNRCHPSCANMWARQHRRTTPPVSGTPTPAPSGA